MAHNLPPLLYIISGVLFILALRGLSSPETARDGNRYGMIGMALAVLTTLFVLENKGLGTWVLIIAGVGAGGAVGATIAKRVKMTDMPQLVAFFHSLVGLAAVFIAWAAFLAPRAFGVGEPGEIHWQSVIEMSLGVAI
ncbi:MAG: NAD(P)(+) transhydrogenase (Re/Si-specific) subunit beta, partial [Parvularculaceae bacterium]|nr:NAD(P)(+) transhydrogenase (Re/Si-specific) subunit beta [Parvularculaceae bacterium]